MKLIVGNFKMNLLNDDIENYLAKIKNYNLPNVIFCPSFIYLNEFIKKGYITGSQDVSFRKMGAYTGDVSVYQLKSIGVKYSIVGHSERRLYYNDSVLVNEKLKLCLSNNIIPILCIGESINEYKKNDTFNILKKEIDNAFTDLHYKEKIIIAYEPIWAIGTGIVPNNEIIKKTIEYIKKYVYNKYEFDALVLYGGSVSNKNIIELEKISNIDGYLVGGCSTKVDDFVQLIEKVNK